MLSQLKKVFQDMSGVFKIRNKVKDEQEVFRHAVIICEFVEEAQLTYPEMGIAGPFFTEIRRFLNEAIGYYNRHRQPGSNCRGLAKRNLKLANTIATKAMVKGMNKLLASMNEKTITMPTNLRELELACHKLFYSPEETSNDGKSTGGGGTKDGKEDSSPIPMAL
jgi:hypothetical protein